MVDWEFWQGSLHVIIVIVAIVVVGWVVWRWRAAEADAAAAHRRVEEVLAVAAEAVKEASAQASSTAKPTSLDTLRKRGVGISDSPKSELPRFESQESDRAVTAGTQEPDVLEATFGRTDSEAWGFAWDFGAFSRERRHLIRSVDPRSPAGRWNQLRRELGARGIERGDVLVCANGASDYDEIQHVLSVASEVTLRFSLPKRTTDAISTSPPTSPDTSNSPLSASAQNKPASLGSSASSQRPVSLPEVPHVKNTFLHFEELGDIVPEDGPFSKSDPGALRDSPLRDSPPRTRIVNSSIQRSPYTPGCLAGVSLNASILDSARAGRAAQSAGAQGAGSREASDSTSLMERSAESELSNSFTWKTATGGTTSSSNEESNMEGSMTDWGRTWTGDGIHPDLKLAFEAGDLQNHAAPVLQSGLAGPVDAPQAGTLPPSAVTPLGDSVVNTVGATAPEECSSTEPPPGPGIVTEEGFAEVGPRSRQSSADFGEIGDLGQTWTGLGLHPAFTSLGSAHVPPSPSRGVPSAHPEIPRRSRSPTTEPPEGAPPSDDDVPELARAHSSSFGETWTGTGLHPALAALGQVNALPADEVQESLSRRSSHDDQFGETWTGSGLHPAFSTLAVQASNAAPNSDSQTNVVAPGLTQRPEFHKRDQPQKPQQQEQPPVQKQHQPKKQQSDHLQELPLQKQHEVLSLSAPSPAPLPKQTQQGNQNKQLQTQQQQTQPEVVSQPKPKPTQEEMSKMTEQELMSQPKRQRRRLRQRQRRRLHQSENAKGEPTVEEGSDAEEENSEDQGLDPNASAQKSPPGLANANSTAGAASGSRPAEADCDDEIISSDDPIIGKRMQLRGLVKCPSFNGLWGVIERVEADTGWYLVRVQTPNSNRPSVIAKVRWENLHVPATIKLDFAGGDAATVPDAAAQVKSWPEDPLTTHYEVAKGTPATPILPPASFPDTASGALRVGNSFPDMAVGAVQASNTTTIPQIGWWQHSQDPQMQSMGWWPDVQTWGPEAQMGMQMWGGSGQPPLQPIPGGIPISIAPSAPAPVSDCTPATSMPVGTQQLPLGDSAEVPSGPPGLGPVPQYHQFLEQQPHAHPHEFPLSQENHENKDAQESWMPTNQQPPTEDQLASTCQNDQSRQQLSIHQKQRLQMRNAPQTVPAKYPPQQKPNQQQQPQQQMYQQQLFLQEQMQQQQQQEQQQQQQQQQQQEGQQQQQSLSGVPPQAHPQVKFVSSGGQPPTYWKPTLRHLS